MVTVRSWLMFIMASERWNDQTLLFEKCPCTRGMGRAEVLTVLRVFQASNKQKYPTLIQHSCLFCLAISFTSTKSYKGTLKLNWWYQTLNSNPALEKERVDLPSSYLGYNCVGLVLDSQIGRDSLTEHEKLGKILETRIRFRLETGKFFIFSVWEHTLEKKGD